MTWRVAFSLDKLLRQLNAMAPWRSKASDGSIGDARHATQNSDHNPWFALKGQPLVTARDFTHDPANGLDCNWLAETLVSNRDSRIKYVIWNGRIIDSRPGRNPWKWMPYHGANPHTKHLHLSVMNNASADDSRAWTLTPYLPLEDEMTPAQEAKLDALLNLFYKSAAQPWGQTVFDAIWEVRDRVKAVEADVAELKARTDGEP
jgi:hypothetical protein